MGCVCSTSSSEKVKTQGYEDPTVLASETPCEYPSSSITGNSVPNDRYISGLINHYNMLIKTSFVSSCSYCE